MINPQVLHLKSNSLNLICEFIKNIDSDFTPPLSTKVNINEWSYKLNAFATNIIIEDDKKQVIALLSFYVNENANSYITFFGISKIHRHKGYGTILLDYCLSYCKKMKSRSITVETWLSNKNAIDLYISKGFRNKTIKEDRTEDKTLVLINILKEKI
ncbi:MAG: GNAT family N-acetyltransferase [Bacteroidales bacterium]|nr:GNAT family N-acetyltransferase [Bacteroidales bacterium]